MNIYVCIKQVPDTETKIKLNSDATGIETAGVKWIVSPYDEFAIEEALRLKEKNAGSTVTVVAAAPERATEAIRTALAMGCDSGIRVDVPEGADSNLNAKALAGALKKQEKVDIVFCGKEAIDDGASQVSQLLAAYLDFPSVAVVLSAEYSADKVTCNREVEGGALETVEVSLPAVFAAQKGLNEPRYASLPNIMKAKKKKIDVMGMDDVGVSESDQRTRTKAFKLPEAKKAGIKIEGEVPAQVAELAKKLHEEAKVI